MSARIQSRLVFHGTLSHQSNDLQRRYFKSVGSVLADQRQFGYAASRRRTSVQSVDLLDSSPFGYELDLLVLLCLESNHGQFISNVKRFSDGFHGSLQVSQTFW